VSGTPPSTGALLISRLDFAAGRPVEWRRTLIRGDRFSLLAEFSARTGYRLAPDDGYPGSASASEPTYSIGTAQDAALPAASLRPAAARSTASTRLSPAG
jgi:hypothetical protein